MLIYEELKNAKTIGISGHVRPDGDCVGACMGLYLYLKNKLPGSKIEVFLEEPSSVFSCIKDISDLKSDFQSECSKFDAFVALDCSADRLGAAEHFYRDASKKINIDHHISNEGDGNVNYIVPTASSTCELVYDVIGSIDEINKDIAMALYIGIIHDTGVMQYSNTSPHTLEIVAKLISFEFDFPRLIDETFYEKTYVQNQILGRALLESILFMDGRCIVSMVDKTTMDFYHANSKDLEGIVSQLRNTKGVECAIFMYQIGNMEYKVSLRSNGKVNVAEVAQIFGGGGHVRAAGASITGTYYDVINNLSQYIEVQLNK